MNYPILDKSSIAYSLAWDDFSQLLLLICHKNLSLFFHFSLTVSSRARSIIRALLINAEL
jgi:hypothetical protein